MNIKAIYDNKTNFSEAERKKLASEGLALPDGSFPIRNKQDLKDACKSYGLAKNPLRAKRWIIKRARELDALDLLPEKWNISDSTALEEFTEIKGITKSFKHSGANFNVEIKEEEFAWIKFNLGPKFSTWSNVLVFKPQDVTKYVDVSDFSEFLSSRVIHPDFPVKDHNSGFIVLSTYFAAQAFWLPTWNLAMDKAWNRVQIALKSAATYYNS